jgi:hypothetical protein
MHKNTQIAFHDELEKIAKASVLKFLAGGAKSIGNVLAGNAVPGAAKAGGTWNHMKQIWNTGAGTVAKGAKGAKVPKRGPKVAPGGFFGGLKALGSSQYGQMAGAVGVPLAAGYGVHKMTSGQ